MKFNFAKTLFASSLFAIGAFGLIACGDDSSSGSAGGDENGEPVEVPTQQDATIDVSGVSARQSGTNMKFYGTFTLNTIDTSSAHSDALQFTNMAYKVAKGADINNLTTVNVNVNATTVTPTKQGIDLGSMASANVSVSLLDTGFTSCGSFMLIVTAYANDGEKDFENTQTIPFTRDSLEFCQEIPSSSSEEPVKQEIQMVPCQIDLSTDMMPGLNLATCTGVAAAEAATADVIFNKAGSTSDPEVEVTSGNGATFAPITNTDDYEVDMWPEDVNGGRNAYLSDFKYRAPIAGPSIAGMIENSNQIYVAKAAGGDEATGTGIYAFAISSYKEGNNGNYNLTVKLYKAQ